MIKEEYVSFEVAKLLKEKEFNEKLLTFYVTDEDKKEGCFQIMAFTDDKIDNNYSDDCYLAPTLQMAMKWLRKVHNLCLFVIPATIDETFRTGYALYPQCDSKWEWCASKNDRSKATFGYDINSKYCNSYEEACEAAIKYCLENLI